MEVLKNYILNDKDFKKVYNERLKDYKKLTMIDTVDDLIDYIFNSEFNPYLDEAYIDYSYLKDNTTGVIYNLDDIFEEYQNQLKGE